MATQGARLGMPALVLAGLMLAPGAQAQPVDLPIPAATTDSYPAGITVRQMPSGPVYVDARGLTLYGLDLRTVKRWAPNPALYCKDACAQAWEPVLAPADAKVNIAYPGDFGRQLRRALEAGKAFTPGSGGGGGGSSRRQEAPADPNFFADPQKAPDWTVIAGPQGPQWVYKGWHMVYTRRGDQPGSTAHDGADGFTWNTLKFVPPAPSIVAPATVRPVFLDGRYALADKDGHVLFTGTCTGACARWEPLAGGFASRGIGEWTVSRTGDRPQWTWRGKPVYVSRADDPAAVPENAEVLRP